MLFFSSNTGYFKHLSENLKIFLEIIKSQWPGLMEATFSGMLIMKINIMSGMTKQIT